MQNLTPQDLISISLSTRAQAESKLLSDLSWAIGTILHDLTTADDALMSSSLPNKMNKADWGHAISLEQPLNGAITPTSRKFIEEHSRDSSMRQEGAGHHPTPGNENLRCSNSIYEGNK